MGISINNKWSRRVKKARTLILSGLAAALISIPATQADDTEIFFGKEGVGAESNPNVLFILDSSGSMRTSDTPGITRMEQMQSAMGTLLDQSSSFNVGLMSFSGLQGGGSVRYPVGYLEEDLATDCPEGGCPDQLVVGRSAASNDDAYESLSTGLVTTLDPRTPFGSLTTSTATTSTTAAAPETTDTSIATASVAEAVRFSDAKTVHQINEPDDLWFYWGTPETHEKKNYAYRFDDVNIPPGATITDAYITFVFSNTARQVGDVSAYISAESRAIPRPYPDGTELDDPPPGTLLVDRNVTNALIAWLDIPEGIGGTSIDTPDLSGLMQEIISLSGWESGNSVSIHIDAFDEVDASLETTRQFFGVAAAADSVPVLTYSYTTADTSDSNSGLIAQDAASHSIEYFNPNSLTVTGNTAAPTADLFSLNNEHELGLLGLRFEDLGIPAGASITGATLKMHVNSASDTSVPGAGPGGTGSGGTDPVGDGTDIREFVVSINAELSSASDAFGVQHIKDRDFTSEFEEWHDISDISDTEVTSPDLKAVLQQLVNQADWDDQSPIMLTLNPGSTHAAELIRNIDTSTGGSPPTPVSYTHLTLPTICSV